MDDIDADAEFLGAEFDVGQGYAWFGYSLERSVARAEAELGRPLVVPQRAAFTFGWHVGRADWEAAKEREAERVRLNEPVHEIDWTGIPY